MEPAVPKTGEPESIDSTFSALCTIGRPPLVMTGSVIWILRRHFSQPNYIVDPNLNKYLWNKDSTKSGITIESVVQWPGAPTQTVQQRPAIYVKRNTYGRVKLGIGDAYQLGTNSSVDKLDDVGDNSIDTGTMYGVVIAGSHTVFCLGSTGAEAESVGTEVFFELLEFTPIIRKDLGLNKFQVMEMGGIAKLEESHEHWVVPVTVTYAFNHDWMLYQDAPLLKTVSLNV